MFFNLNNTLDIFPLIQLSMLLLYLQLTSQTIKTVYGTNAQSNFYLQFVELIQLKSNNWNWQKENKIKKRK